MIHHLDIFENQMYLNVQLQYKYVYDSRGTEHVWKKTGRTQNQ